MTQMTYLKKVDPSYGQGSGYPKWLGSLLFTTPPTAHGDSAAPQLHWNRKRIGELRATHLLQIENKTSGTWEFWDFDLDRLCYLFVRDSKCLQHMQNAGCAYGNMNK